MCLIFRILGIQAELLAKDFFISPIIVVVLIKDFLSISII
jgi:hypothetical protein